MQPIVPLRERPEIIQAQAWLQKNIRTTTDPVLLAQHLKTGD